MKKNNRKVKGSIFRKLIASYIVFALVAIISTIICIIVSALLSWGDNLDNNFPIATVKEDGEIASVDGVIKLGGWVEQLDENYQVQEVFGDKLTTDENYTVEQLLDLTRITNFNEEYHVFLEPYSKGSYLVFYPRDAFNIVFNFDTDKVITSSIGRVALWLLLLLLIIDVAGISYYISRKIRRPLKDLMDGMKRIEDGDEKVVLSMRTEREFVEIQDAFNRMVERLEDQKAENEKMSRSRQKMLLELSHDIKTPVATIKSYAFALQEGIVKEEELEKYYTTIASKADRVNTMSDDLFTMLKMESSDYMLDLKELNITELIRQICAEYYEEFVSAGYDFIVDIPDENIYIQGDKTLLSRVISNLLINAKKYNKTGKEIEMKVSTTKDKIKLAVIDDGEEINQNIQSTMFSAFVRGESERSTSGGTGLGLAIAKGVVAKHGGQISYVYEENSNMFVIEIPMANK